MSGTVSILGGTGSLGFGLAARLGLAGFSVCIGSRDAERAAEAADRATALAPGATFTGDSNARAVDQADRLVVITIPFASQASTLKSVADHWRPGQVALDATVPLATAVGGPPTQTLQPWHGSAAEQARSAIPATVSVASGLHTVSAASLLDLSHPLDQDTLVCGDDPDAKAVVSETLGCIDGLRVVDAGRLSMSRLAESITPLLIGINIRHKTHAGLRLTNLGA